MDRKTFFSSREGSRLNLLHVVFLLSFTTSPRGPKGDPKASARWSTVQCEKPVVSSSPHSRFCAPVRPEPSEKDGEKESETSQHMHAARHNPENSPDTQPKVSAGADF